MQSPKLNDMPSWFQSIFKSLGLREEDSCERIFELTDSCATKLAPDTRRFWRVLFTFEAIAAFSAIFWLLGKSFPLPPTLLSGTIFLFSMIVVAFCWWARWRGMQHAWIKTRLVAEIARSRLATRHLCQGITSKCLANDQAIRKIALYIESLPVEKEDIPSDQQTLEWYRQNRILDQKAYYLAARDSAEKERQRLSRYVTMALDGALFLAVGGVTITLSDLGVRLLSLSGLGYLLGTVGVLLPLSAVIFQALGAFLQLNRQTGRYTQQFMLLATIDQKIQMDLSRQQLYELACEVEQSLLSEVIEWHYQSERTELFYRLKTYVHEDKGPREERQEKGDGPVGSEYITAAGPDLGLFSRALRLIGLSSSFVGRVIFGRLLVIALSMVLTTALISYYVPSDVEQKSSLKLRDGRLLSEAGSKGWTVHPDRAMKGLIVIVHGLHDGVEDTVLNDGKLHWMTEMQQALETALGGNLPEVVLVDWQDASVPTFSSTISLERPSGGKLLPQTPQGWLQDIAAIRPTAEEIGKLVGMKLVIAIQEGKLHKNRPIHLIGHSAGGFVVLKIATTMKSLGIVPDEMALTLLDTPFPKKADLSLVAEFARVDFYVASRLAQGVPGDRFSPNYRLFEIKRPDETDAYLESHSYAHQWYIRTILEVNTEGFARSPFASLRRKNQ